MRVRINKKKKRMLVGGGKIEEKGEKRKIS